ncbi:MAG: helix-turn-helix transcriptional regulator [Bacillaceae bacterium]|nr:helix-turn-helix transcriptional regulator [Bacillaceae bacterium]
MGLKNRLKELRAREGLNQTQLAKKINASRQTVSLIERGDYAPSIILALRIAEVFNEKVENVFILEGEEE